ncbi:MAG TPA: hypothetical protein VK871_09310 [Candidatus Limnocylindrales bacterium]|nr:hypothetical protein [Candidatus Limnocylindrales bacterium]
MKRRVPTGPPGWQAVIAVVGLALLAWVPTTAAAEPPSGNNATVKVHEGATEVEPIVANEPHVCTFHLHFFFADPTQAGDWEIQSWSPDDSGEVVLSGTYDTAGDGEDRVPGTGTLSLTVGHYKLFWQGRDDENVKHKAFWVECGPEPASVAPSVSQSPSTSPTGSEEPASSDRSSPSGGGVLGVVGTPPGGLPSTDSIGTSSGGVGLAVVLLCLAAFGGLALAFTVRRA